MATSICPICGARTHSVAPCFRVNNLPSERLPRLSEAEQWRCGHCGFRWIDPAPPIDALLEGYEHTDADHWGEAGTVSAGAESRQYSEKVSEITRIIPGGRALDVGCFHGEFLSHLPGSFERVGIEVAKGAAAVARERGITVIESDVMTAEVPGKFDLVYCSDVIEHIVDQHEFADRLSQWLAPNGLLVLETGDADAPLARIMGARWYYLALLEHVCAHTRPSMNQLMGGVELLPLKVERRWHDVPSSMVRPAKRAAMALTFLGVTSALGLVRRAIPLPGPADRLYRRFAPAHATRDHLWAMYTHRESELLP